MPGAETRTSAHLCTMPLSVTVTSTKLILSGSGIQIRFNGQDIIEAKPSPRNAAGTVPQSQGWYVLLRLTGDAREAYGKDAYELRLLDIDPSSQPTWTNNQTGAEQAAADIAVMIRSAPGGGGGGQVDTIVPGPGVDVDSTDPANPIVSTRQKNSIEVDANELQLVGDEASPGNDEYYGTDGSGNKGFHPLPSPGTGDVVGPASSTDDHVVLFDGATGKLIKDSGYTPGGLVIPTGFGDIDLIETSAGFWPVEIKGGLDGDATEMQSNTGSFQVNVKVDGVTIGINGSNELESLVTDTGITQLTGDVTAGPGSGSQAATIANNAVTFAKMQAVSTNVLLGNDATGTAVEEIACTSAGRAILDDATAADQRTTLGLGTAAVAGVKNSVQIDSGDIQLVGDSASPGNSVFYGTNSSGTRSFYRPPLIFSINSAGSTLTNHANALELPIPTNPGIFITKLDLTGFTQVMLQVHVYVASASGNSPRVILGYATSYTTTAGSYSDIGTSAVTCSMSSTGVIRSAWTDLAAGAIGDVWISPLTNGGNGAADPVIQGITAYFR